MTLRGVRTCLLPTAFLLLPTSGCDRRKGGLDRAEEAGLVRAARAECARMNVPTDDREVTVTSEGARATVTFHVPEGTRGGDFIVKIDRATGEITDVKIWR